MLLTRFFIGCSDYLGFGFYEFLIEELSGKQMTAEIRLQLNPYNSNPRFYKLAATGITSLSHQTTVNVALPSIFRTF